MDAKFGINCITKQCCMYILLTIVGAMATLESSLARETNQNSSVQHHINISVRAVMVTKAASQVEEDQWRKSAVVGTAAGLDCPQPGYELIVWNVYLYNGTDCYLSYSSARNLTDKNCSENINWLNRPDQLPSLQIRSPQISSEGIYKCSIAYANGTFTRQYSVTVLVPPEVSLTEDINGNPVCKAVAGKPAAQISWLPAGNNETVTELLLNGTETITSVYSITNTSEGEIACIVSHPAWKESHVLSLSLGRNAARRNNATMRILYTILICLLGIFIPLFFIYLWRFFSGRKTDVNELKSPETISTRLSFQENETQPYATFVQVENVIYDKASDFLPGFSSST